MFLPELSIFMLFLIGGASCLDPKSTQVMNEDEWKQDWLLEIQDFYSDPTICLTHDLGISHLHESKDFYIVPTCGLQWEFTALVAGINSKLLLVICQPFPAIILVCMDILL